MNIASVKTCPRCNKPGKKIGTKKKFQLFRCGTCGTQWQTLKSNLSKPLCPECGNPNGYNFPGLCVKCYSKRRKVSN